jgi:hypothetical protein
MLAYIIHKIHASMGTVVQAAKARKLAFAWLKQEESDLESAVQGMQAPTELPTWGQRSHTSASRLSIMEPMPPNLLAATFEALPVLKKKAVFQLQLKDEDFEPTEEKAGNGSSALSQMQKVKLPFRVKTQIHLQMVEYLVCHYCKA